MVWILCVCVGIYLFVCLFFSSIPIYHRFQTTTLPITVPLTSASFSRRRPPPPGSALPIISSLTSSTLSNQSNNSQQLDTQVSPVTLAAPRPETERLANEYVDTPFRTPKLVSRLQHAGVHTTHRYVLFWHPCSCSVLSIHFTYRSMQIVDSTLGLRCTVHIHVIL